MLDLNLQERIKLPRKKGERLEIWNNEEKKVLEEIANNPNYYFENKSMKYYKNKLRRGLN